MYYQICDYQIQQHVRSVQAILTVFSLLPSSICSFSSYYHTVLLSYFRNKLLSLAQENTFLEILELWLFKYLLNCLKLFFATATVTFFSGMLQTFHFLSTSIHIIHLSCEIRDMLNHNENICQCSERTHMCMYTSFKNIPLRIAGTQAAFGSVQYSFPSSVVKLQLKCIHINTLQQQYKPLFIGLSNTLRRSHPNKMTCVLSELRSIYSP